MSDKHVSILFVHNNNDLYGADVILLEIVKRLDRRRFYPIVILPADVRHINRLSLELEKNGIEHRFVRLGIMRRKYFRPLRIAQYFADLIIGVVSLAWLIYRRKVAVVHSNTMSVSAGALAAYLMRVPHVWHIHEIIVGPVRMRRAMHWLVPRLSRAVLCVSNPVRDHIAAEEPLQVHKLRVIHNGIELERFSGPADGMRIRREFGISADAPLIGMIGKVCDWKGQVTFAAAAQRVLQRHPQARFLAVGGVFDDQRHYMDEFRAEVGRLGISHAFFISDFRQDVRDVLSAYDIFTLPSIQPDPFPTVVLEAMAAAKPVVATAHGGPLEMVVDGETGYLVRPKDAEDLAAALCKLLEHPLAIGQMGEAGRRRVWENFYVRDFIARLESMYAEMCGFRPPFQDLTHKSAVT